MAAQAPEGSQAQRSGNVTQLGTPAFQALSVTGVHCWGWAARCCLQESSAPRLCPLQRVVRPVGAAAISPLPGEAKGEACGAQTPFWFCSWR